MVTEANRGRYRHYRLAAGLYSGLSRFRPQSLDYGRRSFASCLMESTCKLSRTEGGNARKPLDRQVLCQVRLRKMSVLQRDRTVGPAKASRNIGIGAGMAPQGFERLLEPDSVP